MENENKNKKYEIGKDRIREDPYDGLFENDGSYSGLFKNAPIKKEEENNAEAKKNTSNKKTEKPKNSGGKKFKNKNTIVIRRLSYFAASLLFIITLTAMFGLSFDFPDRKSFSESEKRELAEFPKLTLSSLFSGDYFDGINLWFSDTFPLRDNFVSLANRIKTLVGIGDSIHNFSENGGDEIPETDDETQTDFVDIEAAQPEKAEENDLMKPALPNSGENATAAQAQGDNIIEQQLNSIYIYGNTAYEYYNFSQSTADKYISAVNKAADEAKANGINLYNMVIPTSIDITLNEKSRSKLNSSDQKEAISYIYSKMNDNVKTVQVFDLLKAHKDEYIYFRTDHHWTALGAYYAYAQYMTVKGGKYELLSNFTEYEFSPYLGSFYNSSGKSASLAQTPDSVFAYKSKYNISFKMRQQGDTDYTEWPLICDATDYSESNKYLCFIGGDNPISVIENNDMTDGETCVLVKESFGNAFAPYLACNYKYVYVIDYRYFGEDITAFAKEKGASDIIIQSNISMTRNASLVDKLAASV